MNLMKKLAIPALAGMLTSSPARGDIYDNFSSGSLNPALWQIRQDPEGQPHLDEYDVRNEGNNFVFHTQQNIIGDRRTYLFPMRTFTTGDSIEYDVNLTSREGTYAQMVLLTGDQYIRIGMRGPAAGFDELGMAHMKLTFQPNNLAVERHTPSGSTLIDNLQLNQQNGTYSLYIGSFTGHNGRAHMDFDDFYVNGIPTPSSFALLGLGVLGGRRKR